MKQAHEILAERISEGGGLVVCDGRILHCGVKYVPERTCRDDGTDVFRCDECGAFVKRGAVMDCCAPIPIRYCPNCGAKVVEE